MSFLLCMSRGDSPDVMDKLGEELLLFAEEQQCIRRIDRVDERRDEGVPQRALCLHRLRDGCHLLLRRRVDCHLRRGDTEGQSCKGATDAGTSEDRRCVEC